MAFPTTSVLDDFAGVSAVLTTPWTGRIRGTGTESGLLARDGSGLCATNTNGTTYSASAWRSDQTYGPDCEVYVTVSTKPGSGNATELWARVSNPASANVSGYRMRVGDEAGTDSFQVYRCDNNVVTALGSVVNQECAAGDGVGMEIVGSTITMYWKSGAGAWTSVGSVVDSTYSSAGYIGLGTFFSTGRYDDFGGGTIAAAPTQDAVIAWVAA